MTSSASDHLRMNLEEFTHGLCREETYEDQQLVFREGEPGDRFFHIVSGTAAVYKHEEGAPRLLVRLGPGQSFGEIALLQQRPRSATVLAQGALRVLSIDGQKFVQLYERMPPLREYLQTLQKVYMVRGRGFVTQHSGRFMDMDAVTTLYHLLDGTTAIGSQVVGRNLFNMRLIVPGAEAAQSVVFEARDGTGHRMLQLLDGRLVGLTVQGLWPELAEAHGRVLARSGIAPEVLEEFRRSGTLGLLRTPQLTDPRQLLCHCLQLELGTLRQAARESNCRSLTELSACTGAGTVCGACRGWLQELVGQASWIPVLVSRVLPAAEGIRSFRFVPQEGQFKPALPAQHVVVQAFIGGQWIQRPYTLTSPAEETSYREITVKREPRGYFSSWLFEKLDEKTPLRLSEAQGNFYVDPQRATPVVCLVAGIGMTPALAICRSFLRRGDKRPLHIDYSVSHEKQLAYENELREATKASNIQLRVRISSKEGRIRRSEVQWLQECYPDADFYICGPGAYQKTVESYLREAKVAPARIHVEAFTPLGDQPKTEVARDTSERLFTLAGVALLAAFFLQHLLGLSWGPLSRWQELEGYQRWSGLGLALFMAYQWSFPVLRFQGPWKGRARQLKLHKRIGLLAPLVYFVHTSHVGYGFLSFLSSVFFANIALGAANPGWLSQPDMKRRYGYSWVIAHILLSVLTLSLMLLHVYISFSYHP
jgi:ferredoxin-NADP reductase